MKPGVIYACIGALAVCLLHVPLLSGEKIPSNEQLSNQDVKDIIALLGRQGNEEDTEASASDPVPSIASSPNGASANNNGASLNLGAASPALNQDEIAQSLALLSTLFSSGQSSPDLSALLGAAAASPTTTTTTTTTTTENPKDAEAAAAQLLTALLSGNGGGGVGGTDAGNLATLLSLATAANPNTQQQQQQQQQGNKLSTTDAQNAALLTNLLLSAGGGAGASQAGGVKQQDFQSFQNAGANLDPSSSNQLSGALNLLSTLGTLGSLGNPQPSLFNLGGQQNAGGGLLSGLLRGAGGGGQSGLLGLLAPQQQQRPGLLASLGNLASVVGTTLGGVRNNLGTGPAKLRGVDTRLGLGYRFGENADAQVLWEIGPQLFTEPLTDEQKQQLRIQQEQLRLQQLQLEQQKQANKNPNRRLMVDRRRTVRRPPPFIPNGKTLARRHVVNTPAQLQQLPQQLIQPPVVKAMPPTSKPSTLEQLMQPPPSYYRRSRPAVLVNSEPVKTNQLNYYAKEEANPLTNVNSQLTEYEQWLLHNPHRSQIHQQQYVVNSPAPKQRRDTFTFTKDSNRNIVRMRVQPRKNLNQVQVIQAVGGIRNEDGMQSMNPVAFSSRMGFQRRSNPGADDSYLRRNAIAFNPRLREIHREHALQEEHVRNLQRRQREQERRNLQRQQKQQERELERSRILEGLQNQPDYQSKPKIVIPSASSSSSLPSGLVRNIQKNANRRIAPQRRRKTNVKQQQQQKALPKTLSEWSENTSLTDMVSNYVINKLKSTGNTVVKTIVPGASLNLDDDLTKIEDDDDDLEHSGSGFRAVIKGFLGVGQPEPKPVVKKPIIKIGEEVAYDELRTIVSGGRLPGTEVHKIPTLSDSSEIMAEASAQEKFPAPTPEIFIDIANGEVSMRKAFGTMESFTPPPPEYIPEDHPRHVFKVLKDQLAQQYEKIKQQQLKEAAKQIRKENLAHGLSNPHDPLYMAANMNMFDLVEKESKK